MLDPQGQQTWQGASYPGLRTLEVVFCGSSDKDLLHVCRLCPGLEHVTIVISMTPGPGGGQVILAPYWSSRSHDSLITLY